MSSIDAGTPRSAMNGTHALRQTTEVMTITPELAKDWLARTAHPNRPVSTEFVDYLSAEIAAGRWMMTHQGIALMRHPFAVLDGQHRLRAVAKSGIAITSMVTWDVDPEAVLLAVDQGKVRTFAHLIKMREPGTKNAATCAALTRGLGFLLVPGRNHTNVISPRERFEIMGAHEEAIGVVATAIAKGRPKPSAAMMVPLIVEYEVDRSFATACMTDIIGGAGLEAMDPILLMRNRWLTGRDSKAGGHSQVHCMGRTIAALDARRNGEKVQRSVQGERRYLRWCKAVGVPVNEILVTAFRMER